MILGDGISGQDIAPPTRTHSAPKMLPTPQAHDRHGAKTPEQIAAMKARTNCGVSNLNETVSKLLPSPRASDGGWDGDKDGKGRRGSSAGFGLRNTSREISRGDHTGQPSPAGNESSDGGHPGQLSLDELAKDFPQDL